MTPSMPRPEVAVVGATGTMGGLVLNELLAKGARVRALVRVPTPSLPSEVEQVPANLGDEDGLRAALTGIRAALFISPHDADEEANADRFVRAAESSGTRIVFAGVHQPTWLQRRLIALLLPSYRGKLRIGERIARSGTSPVVFSPTNFFQNDEIFEDDIRAGQFPMPIRRANRVDVRDVAELCARALLEPDYPTGAHTIAGPVSLSGAECAGIWATALNRTVTYVGRDRERWLPIFRRRLTGQKLTDLISTSLFLGRVPVDLPKAAAATAKLLGHEPRRYHDYVAERAAAVRRPTPRAPR